MNKPSLSYLPACMSFRTLRAKSDAYLIGFLGGFDDVDAIRAALAKFRHESYVHQGDLLSVAISGASTFVRHSRPDDAKRLNAMAARRRAIVVEMIGQYVECWCHDVGSAHVTKEARDYLAGIADGWMVAATRPSSRPSLPRIACRFCLTRGTASPILPNIPLTTKRTSCASFSLGPRTTGCVTSWRIAWTLKRMSS